MQIVPLIPVPSQTVTVQLGSQSCTLNVYQLATGLYIDVFVNDTLIIGGVSCLDANRIVRNAYLGFVGDLAFFDTQGLDDPAYGGLGPVSPSTQFILAYLTPGDLQSVGLSE